MKGNARPLRALAAEVRRMWPAIDQQQRPIGASRCGIRMRAVTDPDSDVSMNAMTDVELTLHLDSEEYRALRLHAIRQGTTVEALLLSLARSDARRAASARKNTGGPELAAAILQRAGIDPGGAEHQEIAARAAGTVRRPTQPSRPNADGQRGAA